MYEFLTVFPFRFLLFSVFISNVYSSEFDIKAKTVILQDYLSGEILYEKEPNFNCMGICYLSLF